MGLSSLQDPALSLAIKGHEPMLHPLALRLQGRDGAEYDDLMQEGRISVWQCLTKGQVPSSIIIFHRMKNWLRYLKPQTPCDYDEMLPLTDG